MHLFDVLSMKADFPAVESCMVLLQITYRTFSLYFDLFKATCDLIPLAILLQSSSVSLLNSRIFYHALLLLITP